MSTTAAPMTVDEFLKLPEVEGEKMELIHGEVVSMAYAGFLHERVKSNLIKILSAWLGQNPFGQVFAETTYRMDREEGLAPDLSVLRNKRLTPVTKDLPLGAPDLAIEVVSSETAARLRTKIRLYLKYGSKAASSNEIVKMSYDEKDWAMLGSISGDTTHIALRVSLKSELPIVNTAATDPTIPETIIPWSLTNIQDDRVQGYTLARRIYTELGHSRVALLRVNERYGRFGVIKFRDASRRLGHPVVIEQKYMPGDADFHHQISVIQDSNVDAIVLWADQIPAGNILKQMREMGMKQPVFGAFRVYGDEMLRIAGPAAEGLEFVFPYDPTRDEPLWTGFNARFAKRFEKAPDAFASLGYDGMRILLDSVCRAGLNRARVRDALYGLERFRGVTGEMVFDPNAKNIAPLFLGTIHNEKAQFRREPMQKAYARIDEETVGYAGPPLADNPPGEVRIGIFGPDRKSVV